MKGLTVLKNIVWAIGILVCLVALVVGFGISAFTKYSLPDEIIVEDAPVVQNSTGTLTRLEMTEDGGQGYLDSLTFLVDSTLIGIRDYGLLSGGVSSPQVWGSSAGNIAADKITDPKIKLADGSEMKVSEAVAKEKPSILVISLGMDSLQKVEREQFEADYISLVETIREKSPNTKIVLCSLSSVASGYSGTDNITVEMSNTAQGWVQNVCRATGAYYADVCGEVKDTSGTLLNEFAGVNRKALNSAGLNKVLEYLRCHMVP